MGKIKLSNPLIVFIMLLTMFCVSSCHTYNSVPYVSLQIDEINLGMNKDDVVKKYGQPFSFDKSLNGNDTITMLSYKTPKVVASCGYIVTTKLLFAGNKLVKISQDDFYVHNNVMYSDTIK